MSSEADKINILELNVRKHSNGKDHHTSDYEVKNLVVRRGQEFRISVVFDKDFNKTIHTLSLEFQLGTNPVISDGSLVEVTSSPVPGEWGMEIAKIDGSIVDLVVYSAFNCLIGKYKVAVIATTENMKESVYKEEIYMLFNPWCKDDAVYMEDEYLRNEYVLEDFNEYYWGNANQIGRSFWNQAQFEPIVLECALYLLKLSGLSRSQLGSPIHIARTLSSMMNSKDNDGVLVGNWTGVYDDGTSPTEWSGSEAIFEEFMETKKPVKYGQCWVFAGLGTSVFRALGIPARTVTTFEAGRDKDSSLTVDTYFSEEDGSVLEDMSSEFVWNFHVWNDLWMARADMPDGFGGWQALDTCPQEMSGGLHRCGPASLSAVKQGQVYYNYDTMFMFAEVNGEEVDWIVTASGKMKPADVNSRRIGKKISTKAVGEFQRQDVTDVYKYPEGTEEERVAVLEATKHVSSGKRLYNVGKKDVKFRIKTMDDAMVGEDIEFRVKIVNENKDESREIFINVTCYSVRYTGVRVHEIFKNKEEFTLAAEETKFHKVVISADEYRDKLTESATLKFFVLAGVRSTGQTFTGHYDYQLTRPQLNVEVPPEVRQKDSFEVQLSFTNPLPKLLQECLFRLESPGMEGHMKIKYRDVAPSGEALLRVKLIAKRPGTRQIIASFHSKQLTGLTGMATFKVTNVQ